MSESAVACGLFRHWLTHEYGRRFAASGAAIYSDGRLSLAIEAHPLLETGDDAWLTRRSRLEAAIADGLPVRIALWVPLGAELPNAEPATSEFIDMVRQAALRLGSHERSYVPFPIALRLRKTAEAGGLVSVSGGLNPFWARFTDRVPGTFDLDSTHLHRISDSPDQLENLLDLVVSASQELRVGQTVAIDTVDPWTIQRLEGDGGVSIVGVSPSAAEDVGLAVRRSFRRILADVGPGLRETEADARALVLVGHYSRMDQEGATTAMRGYDPMLYRGIDFVCLAADGLVKPMIKPPPGSGWEPVAAGVAEVGNSD